MNPHGWNGAINVYYYPVETAENVLKGDACQERRPHPPPQQSGKTTGKAVRPLNPEATAVPKAVTSPAEDKPHGTTRTNSASPIGIGSRLRLPCRASSSLFSPPTGHRPRPAVLSAPSKAFLSGQRRNTQRPRPTTKPFPAPARGSSPLCWAWPSAVLSLDGHPKKFRCAICRPSGKSGSATAGKTLRGHFFRRIPDPLRIAAGRRLYPGAFHLRIDATGHQRPLFRRRHFCRGHAHRPADLRKDR
jgi:hypothetical protein